MATTIKIKRGTRTNLDSLATSNSLVAGEPILITDEDRLAVATGVSTYEAFAKVSEVIANGMTNPMTTTGDIIYGGSSGTPTRLPKGTDGQVLSLSSGIPSWQNVSVDVDAKQDKNLKFTDTSASSWDADATYTNYGYKCELTLSGVTSTDIAEVTFGHSEAISGNYSPVCLTATNKVTIYSKVNTTITIPTILINKQS